MRYSVVVSILCFFQATCSYPHEICSSCVDKALKNKRCIIDSCNCSNDNSVINISEMVTWSASPPPKVLCREEQMMILIPGEFTENTTYFVEYRLKGKNNSFKYSTLTICRNLEVFKLEPDSSYDIRLYGISMYNKTFTRSSLTTGRTLPQNFSPKPVDILDKSLEPQSDSYNVVLRWSYVHDSDRSCCYDVLWFNYKEGEHYQDELREPRENYTITNLQLEGKYFFSIIATTRNRLKESRRKNITITIPTCAETYGNLEQCRPEMPSNFHVGEVLVNHFGVNPIYNIVMNWSAPKLEPYYYSANIITYHDEKRSSMNISGNATEAVFTSVELGLEYAIKLVAWSPKGPSKPAFLHRQINGTTMMLAPRVHSVKYEYFLVVSAIAIAAVVLLIITMCICRHCRAKHESNGLHVKYRKDAKSSFSKNMIRELTIRRENDEWEINEKSLTTSSALGDGAFGIVHKGLYKNSGKNVEIAIKMLRGDVHTKDQILQFYDEIEIMKSVPKHPHLVSLIGIVTKEREENPMMVVEYCAKGDLQSFLKNTWEILTNTTENMDYINNITLQKTYANTNVFSNKIYEMDLSQENLPILAKELISMARQTALGMEFLSSIKVLHRDLAARNVLVCANNTIKISDFGLSRDVYKDNVYLKTGGGKLPFRWMAVESMTHQRYTTQSDVWSFGILLWEIVTLGSTPYPGVNTQDLLSLLRSGYRMEKPNNCSDELYSIMMNCWRAIPQERPTFSDLVRAFEKLLENETPYLTLNNGPSLDKLAGSRYAIGNVTFSSVQSDRYLLPGAIANNKCEKA